MRRNLRILLYGDVDLNFMDGSAVWLTSLANVLNKDPNIIVDVLLKGRIKNKNLLSEIENLKQINVIDTFTRFKSRKFENGNRMNVREAVQLMNELDKENNYHCIVVRGLNLVREILQNKRMVHKTIPYVTDFNHDKDLIAPEEKLLLQEIYHNYPAMFVQTKEMGEALKNVLSVNGDKLALLLPMIPDYDTFPDFKNENNSLVYAGKFAKDWYTEEIINAFDRIHEKDSTITLNVAGDKFQGELIPLKDEISAQLREKEGINWVGAISRSASLDLIKESDIGIGWRSENIDNDESVEISTKLLEYGRLGKPVILRRTKLHEKLLGKDYFLFVENEDEYVQKTLEILSNRKLYRKTAKRIYESCKEYTFSAAYERLKPLLWSFNQEKIKLLFAGHDLKFIQLAIDYFSETSRFDVKIDKWQGHNKHDEDYSKKCLEWADVIFCEWGLGNAVWYSNQKNDDQKLIVRMHAQERKTEYPKNFNYDKIDKIIAISPYIYEEFYRIFKMPRNKMVMLYNMIDTKKFNKPKNTKDLSFNIGICGILPSSKRFDRAVNIFEKLWENDSRYKLFVKGKLPQDLPWIMNREEEGEYYRNLFNRIENASWSKNVVFEKPGNDVDEWLTKIGFILSTSDSESFHLAPMEGMASGSVPVVYNWEGSKLIYPNEFVFDNEEQMIDFILNNKNMNDQERTKLTKYPYEKFDKEIIIGQLENLLL